MTDMQITAPTLDRLDGIDHGFFSREGGVSDGIFRSLNCGFGSSDDSGNVAENRARIAAALGLPAAALVTVYQIHSPEIVTVTAPWLPTDAPQADAMVTREPSIALGILAADCAPVLFADAVAGVVGAAHAGWKGALGGVVEATVAGMVALGAAPSRITAAVGPCIAQSSYEVGPEFLERFLDADRANSCHFAPSARRGHHMFDLPGYALKRLRGAGLDDPVWLGQDTCADEARFFSYRRSVHRDEGDYGRQISAIALRG